jgi:hypothetical protein
MLARHRRVIRRHSIPRRRHPPAADPDDSLAFLLGIAPLVVATGAGAKMRQSLGTAVFGDMLRHHRLRPNLHPDLLHAGAALRLRAGGTTARRSPPRPELSRRVGRCFQAVQPAHYQ